MKNDVKIKKNEEHESKIEELDNKYKRALADYQNLEKRVREEKQDWIASSNKNLILRLLPILDTLMLAQNHSKDEVLSLSVKHFLDILKGEGIEKIETIGGKFDPGVMECVEVKEGNEGEVIDEVRAGYLMNGKTLRPALVSVGGKK